MRLAAAAGRLSAFFGQSRDFALDSFSAEAALVGPKKQDDIDEEIMPWPLLLSSQAIFPPFLLVFTIMSFFPSSTHSTARLALTYPPSKSRKFAAIT